MVEQSTPQLLVARAQQGDRQAFEQLLGSHEQRLRSFVSSRLRFNLGPRLELEEILQDTFVRAFESIERFRWQSDDSFFRWLCGIAKHVLMKAAEESRKSPGVEVEEVRDFAGRSDSPSRDVRRDERHDRLQRSLDELPQDYRDVVRLARIEGLKIKEIAARMNRSPDSVKHLLARALLRLRESFGDTESLHLPDRQLRFEEQGDGGA